MNCFKKIPILFFVCVVILLPQRAHAGEISNAVDEAINLTAKAAYCVTKYTLKASWFVVKKTAKGTVAVSKSICKGTKDAFGAGSKSKPVNKNPDNNIYVLPPVPEL